MITDIILTILSWFLDIVNYLLPVYNPLPSQFQDALNWLFTQLARFEWLVPVSSLFAMLQSLIVFITFYYTAKIIFMIVGFIRGTNKLTH